MKNFMLYISILFVMFVSYYLFTQKSTSHKGINNEVNNHETEYENNMSKIKVKSTINQTNNKPRKILSNNIVTLEDALKEISLGHKVEPIVLKNVLLEYYADFDHDADVSITLKLTPIFIFLSKHYAYYKNIILKLYEEKETHVLLRLPMLEIIANNLKEKESHDTVLEVFMDRGDDELVLGYSAKALAKHKIDISKELLDRYNNASDIEKKFYSHAFAYLKTKEALTMIESDLDSIDDISIKSSLLQAYANISPNDEQVITKLVNSIEESPPMGKDNNMKKEILNVQSLMALSKSTKPEVYEKIIKIAFDDTKSIHTRAEAIISLYELPDTVDKQMVIKHLNKLKIELSLPELIMSQDEKDFLILRIDEAIHHIKRSR